MNALPAGPRIALLLRRFQGLPLDEIARLTEVSIATVKRRVASATEALARGDVRRGR